MPHVNPSYAIQPRAVDGQLEALEVVLDPPRASIERITVVLVRGARSCELQDHIVLALFVEPRLVGTYGTHCHEQTGIEHRRLKTPREVMGEDAAAGSTAGSSSLMVSKSW